jgi:hypothetical protein
MRENGEAEMVDRSSAAGNRQGAGGLIFLLAMLAGVVWIIGAAGATMTLLGAARMSELGGLEWAALSFMTLMPALIIWLAGAAAREGAMARAEAQYLADAADRMMNPSPVAELAARKMAVSIRGEVSALERALEATLAKLNDVDGVIARQSDAVDRAARLAQENAGALISGLETERASLVRMSDELARRAEEISASVARQANAISAVANQATERLNSVDALLAERLASFDASSALITDRTKALTTAANSTHDSAARLEKALADSLDSLAKATELTDAAKQSAQEATFAANATAGSIRDTTQRAVDDARRAADFIRNEAAAFEREAKTAISRLRSAAGDPASAAPGEPSAPDGPQRPPTTGSRPFFFGSSASARISQKTKTDSDSRALIEAAGPGYGPTGAKPQGAPRTSADRATWTWQDMLGTASAESETLADELSQRGTPKVAGYPPGRVQLQLNPSDEPVFKPAKGAGAKMAGPGAQILPPEPAASFSAPSHPMAAVRVIEQAGVQFEQAFTITALDRIASRARNGTQARRRAVRDGSPDAVALIGAHLAVSAAARQEAAVFLSRDGARIADLLGRGRASMSADSTRAFLLIDAASS